ncbi:MAG: DUF4258 domain-containing protein [Roseburia sp.]|nr:DUF4258 domain-containing protein [Roseburia sp.]
MKFCIDIGKSGQVKKEFQDIIKDLKHYEKQLFRVSNEIGKISGLEEMEQTVAALYEEVFLERQSLEKLLGTYEQCVQCYEDTEKKLVSSETLDWHMMLDIGGLFPGIGMVCDGVNAGWYALEKDWGNALLSGVSFLPVIGEISGAGKVGVKVAGHADDIIDIAKTAEKVEDVAKAAGEAEDVSKCLDGIIKGSTSTLAQYGDDFGKMGTYVENPNIKVDWTKYAEHAAERMQQRGMTQEMVNNIVENGKVLSQNNGKKFAYITQEGVVIISKDGKLITAWSSADFDSSMLEIINKLFGE